jgi:uncharacterized protein
MASEIVDASTDEPGNIKDALHYADGTNAGKAATCRANRIGRIGRAFEITMPGTMDIIAGSILTLQGFRDGVDGEWLVKAVRQSVGRNGWQTTLTGEGTTSDETYRKPSKSKKKQAEIEPDETPAD